jgi:MFS family permease
MTAGQGVAQRCGWYYYGWNIVGVCVLVQAASSGLPVYAFSLFLRDWSRDLHSPISSMQLAMSALGLGSALLAPFTGLLADKYPIRWLFLGGLVGMVLFNLGVSFVVATWQLQALFGFLLPAGLAFSTAVLSNALVSRWFVRRLGLALGVTGFGLGLASAVLPPILAAVMPIFGWRIIWRIASLTIACVVIPVMLLVLRDRPTEREGLHYLTGVGSVRPYHSRRGASDVTWRDILSHGSFWLLLAVYLPVLALYGACLNNLAPIASSRGLSQQSAGVLLSAAGLSHLGATVIAGMLSDRFGYRLPLAGLALATAIGGVTIAFGQSIASLGAGFILIGLTGGLFTLLTAAAAAEFGANGVGRGFGLLTMFVPVISLTPFLVAKIQERTGSYVIGLVGLVAITCLGGTACLFMRERSKDQSNTPIA